MKWWVWLIYPVFGIVAVVILILSNANDWLIVFGLPLALGMVWGGFLRAYEALVEAEIEHLKR